MISGDSVLVLVSCRVVSSYTTATTTEAHEYHENKENKDHPCICLVGAGVGDHLFILSSITVELGWCSAKRSKLADSVEPEYARDNDCGYIDTLCQAKEAASQHASRKAPGTKSHDASVDSEEQSDGEAKLINNTPAGTIIDALLSILVSIQIKNVRDRIKAAVI